MFVLNCKVLLVGKIVTEKSLTKIMHYIGVSDRKGEKMHKGNDKYYVADPLKHSTTCNTLCLYQDSKAYVK